MEKPFQNITRRRRDFKSQHNSEDISDHIKSRTDNAGHISVAKTQSKNDKENQIDGHETRS